MWPGASYGELLAEFDQSAMSGRKFAEWARICYTTLANWLQERRRWQASQSLAIAEVAPAPVEPDPVRWVVVQPPRPLRDQREDRRVGRARADGRSAGLGDETQIQLAARFLRELGRDPGR